MAPVSDGKDPCHALLGSCGDCIRVQFCATWSPHAQCSKVNQLSDAMPRYLRSWANATGRFSESSWRDGWKELPQNQCGSGTKPKIWCADQVKCVTSDFSKFVPLWPPAWSVFKVSGSGIDECRLLFLWTKSVLWCWFEQHRVIGGSCCVCGKMPLKPEKIGSEDPMFSIYPERRCSLLNGACAFFPLTPRWVISSAHAGKQAY